MGRAGDHVKHCATQAIPNAGINTALFTVINAFQGQYPTVRSTGIMAAGIYAYYALQCPMEAIEGRRSVWHNFGSGATLGFLGVQQRMLGIPFLSESMHRTLIFRNVPMALVGGGVYGAMGFGMGLLNGKDF
tara:strand:+ start:914 stop:1309 length:396 start_codon:yes stop_codon:yes gene_type:complete